MASVVPTTEILEQVRLAAIGGQAESDEYWRLVQELHARSGADVFGAGRAWCESENEALRAVAADILGQLGYDQGHPFATASEPLLSQLLQDDAPGVVASALVALGHLGVGDASAISALSSNSDAGVRRATAVCLGPRPGVEAVRALIRLSRDVDVDVRNWATFGLGSMRADDSPSVREALTARLADPDFEVRGEAMVGLAERGVREIIPAVLSELKTTASTLAVQAAGVIADPAFVPELDSLLVENPNSHDLLEARSRCKSCVPRS